MAEELKPAIYRLHEQADQDRGRSRAASSFAQRSSRRRSFQRSVRRSGPSTRTSRSRAFRLLKTSWIANLSTPAQSTALLSAFAAACAAARVARIVRRALLRRNTTHQRNRRAHGVGRDFPRHIALLRQTRPRVDARRTRHWPGPGGDRVAPDDHAALRLPARLCPDCRGRIAYSPGGGRSGLFCSRTSCIARRSSDCPAKFLGPSGSQDPTVGVLQEVVEPSRSRDLPIICWGFSNPKKSRIVTGRSRIAGAAPFTGTLEKRQPGIRSFAIE